MRLIRLCALLLVGALTASGCTGASGTTEAGGGPALKTDHGVTDSTITLGILTDNSGPLADLGSAVTRGQQIWLDAVNAAGGICARQLRFETRDSGGRSEVAETQFAEMEPNVVGLIQVLGDPVLAALYQDLIDRKVMAASGSFSSELLRNPYLLVAGATYDLEMINGLAYLMGRGELRRADTLGHIYLGGTYGDDGLAGSTYFAKRHGLKVKSVAVTAADADLTATVAGLERAGVRAIALTTSPIQTASVASAVQALGLDVPLIGNSPSFTPSLMWTPAAGALAARLHVVGSTIPFSASAPKAKEIAMMYGSRYNDPPSNGVQFGFALGEIWNRILVRACAAGDLTREGVRAAVRGNGPVTADRLVPGLDFADPQSPATRQVYVAVPDRGQLGGLRQVRPLFAAPDTKTYLTARQN
ncbi:ABC transporter substrate-binding protein [Sporichthya sp.]|uniref:ABC transporter substrate-binding protein n=1 Tax=Sporichthya sp. TaxID=65475 RepID=UPI0017E692BC|nr:ABC transporter substrate-binding protein [Sporichthya sp.]MBA3741544.1 ABC transporter substrate-binding protein [Sporichthya sp.]